MLAGVIAAGVWLIKRKRPPGWLFLAALAGVLCQIVPDLLTSYGTMILEPLSHRRFALDWIFILDPYFTAIVLVTLVVSWRRMRRDKPWRGIALRGMAVLGLYVLMLGAFHDMAMDRLREELKARGLASDDVDRVACLPVPLVPVAWNAVYSSADGSEVATGVVWVLRSEGTIGFHRVGSVADSDAVRAFAESPRGRIYLWFARFPVVSEKESADGRTVVEAYDERFRTWLPLVGRTERTPFRVRAVVGADGKVASVELED